MKKTFSFVLIAVTVIMLISSCNVPEMCKSTLQTTAFTEKIDSSSMETLRFYDSKSKLQYSVSNDMDNLYVCIKATEEQTQFKIIRAGMQLIIGNLTKANPQAKIQYPLALGFQKPNTVNLERKSGSVPQRLDLNSMKLQFRSKYQEMHLTGFKPQIEAVLGTHNVRGITVNLDWDTINTMYYKAIIPFKTFYKDRLDLSDSSRVFDINITINGIEMPHRSEGAEGGGNRMAGGGMGGMGGGGMGRGGMGGASRMGGGQYGGQSHSEMNEENKIKFKLQLAVGKN